MNQNKPNMPIRPFAKGTHDDPVNAGSLADLLAAYPALQELFDRVSKLEGAASQPTPPPAEPNAPPPPGLDPMAAALEGKPIGAPAPPAGPADPAGLLALEPPHVDETLEAYVARVLAPAGVDPGLWGAAVAAGPLPPAWTPDQVSAAKRVATEATSPPLPPNGDPDATKPE